MTCPNHPDAQAVAFCRTCGKPLCEACKNPAQGTIYCAEHAPAAAPPPAPPAATPAPAAAVPHRADPGVSPGLAAFLGLIPGVGAIYNGQYAKGLVHALIFGMIISIMQADHGRGESMPMLGFLMVAWTFYMVFEAYHTARKRMMGEPVDEFSSLINRHRGGGQFPTSAVLLIVLGVVLLMNTLDILDFRYLARYWPVALIVAGVYMLWTRLSAQPPVSRQEVRDGHE